MPTSTATSVNRSNSSIKEQRKEALNTAKEKAKNDLKKILAKRGHDFNSAKRNEKLWRKVKAAYKKRTKKYFQEITSSRQDNRSNVKNQISQINFNWDSLKHKLNELVNNKDVTDKSNLTIDIPVSYEVPMVFQEKSMSCWHASVRMIWASKYNQSIDPLADTYFANSGISPGEFSTLANQFGLKSVPEINQSYSGEKIAKLLSNHGPLWTAGYWDGYAHVIVITGITSDGKLIINDPAVGLRTENVSWFNEKIANDISNPIMFLP